MVYHCRNDLFCVPIRAASVLIQATCTVMRLGDCLLPRNMYGVCTYGYLQHSSLLA